MQAPPEPQGNSPLHSYLRKLRSYVMSLEIKPGRGYKRKIGPGGTVLDINPGAGGSTGVVFSRHRLASVSPNYIVGTTWDGVTEGTDPVYIAKPYKLRHSTTLAVVDGSTITYTYSTVANNLDKMRSATNGSVTETHYVTPRWLNDDEIYAVAADTDVTYTSVSGTVTETLTCTMMDANIDARAWAAQ